MAYSSAASPSRAKPCSSTAPGAICVSAASGGRGRSSKRSIESLCYRHVGDVAHIPVPNERQVGTAIKLDHDQLKIKHCLI